MQVPDCTINWTSNGMVTTLISIALYNLHSRRNIQFCYNPWHHQLQSGKNKLLFNGLSKSYSTCTLDEVIKTAVCIDLCADDYFLLLKIKIYSVPYGFYTDKYQ